MKQNKIDKKIDSFFNSEKISLEEMISEQLDPILESLHEQSGSLNFLFEENEISAGKKFVLSLPR